MSNSFDSDQTPVSYPQPQRKTDNSGHDGHLGPRLIWTAGFFIVVISVGIGMWFSSSSSKANSSPNATAGKAAVPTRGAGAVGPSPTDDSVIKIYILGEVQNPGVYEMQPGDRIQEAIQAAGGFTAQADQTKLDLAQRVRDEMRIEIPRLPNTPTPLPTTGPGTPTATAPPAPTTAAPAGKVNINAASAAELDRLLPGIGPVLAGRIVEYRTNNGPFKTLDDLRKVTGLSKSIIDKIKDLITF